MAKTELTENLYAARFDEYPGDERPTDRDRERWKVFRRRYHAAQRLEPVGDFPIQLDIGLNSNCNLSCPFCIQSTPERKAKKPTFLSFADYSKVIDEAAAQGLVSLKLNHNNEPLLVSELPEYIRYAKSKGILNVYIATNGTLLTARVSRELIDAGLTKIMVSLDAITPETYTAMRGIDKLSEITWNILTFLRTREALGRRFPLVRVNFLRTPVNISEAAAFAARWKGIADMIGFQDQLGVPGVSNNSNQLPWPAETFRCSFPFKHIVVGSDGTLYPCCTFSGEQMPIGNIKSMNIRQAWNSDLIKNLRELHRAGNYKMNSICRHCVGLKD